MSQHVGLLLINLGTPDGAPTKGPTGEQVRVYLRQFLMDRFVIDIPFLARWLLVKLILRKRPEQSAEAYRKIWTERGSPLLNFHMDLFEGVKKTLAEKHGFDPNLIEPAMRYGNPSIPSGLKKLKDRGATEVILIPLYPQYSMAATESSLDECQAWVSKHAPGMKLKSLPAFYKEPEFIDAFASVARESLQNYPYEHVLFSFHGLPERHVKKTDRSGGKHCLQSTDCCERITEANRDCYRAQSFVTARAIAEKLGLRTDQYTICFQSRLGRTPWIKPYTDVMYEELAKKGIQKVAVLCPAFVADCLETLEEIELRGHEQFKGLCGGELKLVPSLNASPAWVAGLSQLIARTFQLGQSSKGTG